MDTNRPKYITDLGQTTVLESTAGGMMSLPRYGVWAFDTGRLKYEVIDTGDERAALQAKHGIPDERVQPVTRA
jgi:hypothetical protein